MTEVNDIRKAFFEEGENITSISRKFVRDRKTVRDYINQEDFNETLPAAERKPRKSKLDPYKEEIDSWLTEDLKARKKQRHTAVRVHERLSEKYPEYDCSYRTVAEYVSKKKKEIAKSNARAYLPLVHKAGEVQVDFGGADFYEDGVFCSGYYLNVSFPYSNAGYLQLFKGENRECLFEGLQNIFEYIGGIPTRQWFDNASTMVSWILSDKKIKAVRPEGQNADNRRIDKNRVFTDSFLRFREHHGFIAAFCNRNSGNEKGNVENKVGYHRRNLLVPVPEFDNLEEYNRELLERSVKDHERPHYRIEASIAELHKEDLKNLLSLPSIPFDCSRYETYKTDNCGKFRIENKHAYSTAPRYAGCQVLVKITTDKVIPLDESHRPITIHDRLYGKQKQESMDWIPYLTQLSRRPGALKYTGVYNMLPDPVQVYMNGLSKRDKGQTLKVLAGLTERNGFHSAVNSISEAITREVKDVESLVTLHGYLNQDTIADKMDLDISRLPTLPDFEFNVSSYDAMLVNGNEEQC